MGKRCGKATLDYIKEVTRRMTKVPTTSWTQNRWQDWAYIIHWALDQDPQGNEQVRSGEPRWCGGGGRDDQPELQPLGVCAGADLSRPRPQPLKTTCTRPT